MFHVEQFYHDILSRSGLEAVIDDERLARLAAYTALVAEAGERFNITGHRNPEVIFEDLVLGSIVPLARINVPRGTFIDIGTGAGVPGVPLAICFPFFEGTLLDSSSKKITFLEQVIQRIGLSNLTVMCARAEEAAHEASLRAGFDWALSRALAAPFVSLELGSAFIRNDGMFYIFSHEAIDSLPSRVIAHARTLGLEPVISETRSRLGVNSSGLLFVKSSSTPKRYPRRFAVIKREAEQST